MLQCITLRPVVDGRLKSHYYICKQFEEFTSIVHGRAVVKSMHLLQGAFRRALPSFQTLNLVQKDTIVLVLQKRRIIIITQVLIVYEILLF